jgi:hypothetical protein
MSVVAAQRLFLPADTIYYVKLDGYGEAVSCRNADRAVCRWQFGKSCTYPHGQNRSQAVKALVTYDNPVTARIAATAL